MLPLALVGGRGGFAKACLLGSLVQGVPARCDSLIQRCIEVRVFYPHWFFCDGRFYALIGRVLLVH